MFPNVVFYMFLCKTAFSTPLHPVFAGGDKTQTWATFCTPRDLFVDLVSSQRAEGAFSHFMRRSEKDPVQRPGLQCGLSNNYTFLRGSNENVLCLCAAPHWSGEW